MTCKEVFKWARFALLHQIDVCNGFLLGDLDDEAAVVFSHRRSELMFLLDELDELEMSHYDE